MRALSAILLACSISSATASTRIENLYTIQAKEDRVIIRNVSDRYLEIRLAIHGTNFVADFRCETTRYLNKGSEHSLEVRPKNASTPIDYSIAVIGLSAKTMAQVTAANKRLPVPPRPVTKEELGTIERLTCESA